MRRIIFAVGFTLLSLGLLATLVTQNAGPRVSNHLALRPAAPTAAAVTQPLQYAAAAPTGAPAAAGATSIAAPAAADVPGVKAPAAPGAADAARLGGPPAVGYGSGGTPPEGPAGPIHYGNAAPQTYQSPLTAGQVDDNAKFAAYLDFIHGYQGPDIHPIPVDRRLFVRVLDGQQHAVAGARVQLFDGARPVFDGRTVSDGRVLFFPQAAAATQAARFRAVVSRGQQRVETTLPADQPEATVTLDRLADNSGPVSLDLVFLLDSTGSMGDEIDTIKATVASIAARIEQLPGSSRPRFGLVTYRDRGDDYVTRSWDFTADVQQFASNLATITAAGGGDYPESVDAGLHDAIHLPGWAPTDTGRHLRLIALVGDAPPHLDYADDYEYTGLLSEAVAAGIKIFPIGASGLTDQGEYIFRQFAQVTQGQFVFITYANGVSGAPGSATDHHIEDYTVHNLDGLVVNLVTAEIANQTGTSAPTGQAPPGPAARSTLIDGAAPDIPAAPDGPGALLAGLVSQVQSRLVGGSVPLWLLLLAAWAAWAGRSRWRARRAGPAGQPFAAPAAPGGAARASRPAARVARGALTVASAAQTLPAAGPFFAYVAADPGGRDTAPLPPLPVWE